MFLCGKDGNELRCCKTGLKIHDSRFHPHSRHAADMYYCEKCGATFINRNQHEYLIDDANGTVDCVISDAGIVWNEAFADKIHAGYGLLLVDNVDELFSDKLAELKGAE